MLEQIHHEGPHLTPGQQWHLRYLDAWQMAFQGDYSKANASLQEVIDHSGDMTLVAKASSLLMSNLGLNRRYEEAFTLANRLALDLPEIRDRLARFTVLANLSQLSAFSGQYDLAISYARMMEDTIPPGETLCNPLSMQVNALHEGNRLTSSSPEVQRVIDTCLAAGQPVFADTMWLLKGNLYLDEGQPGKALDLLHKIIPGINENHYYSHVLAAQVELAQANAKLGNDSDAKKAALSALAMSSSDDISTWLKDVYEVLYQIEKRQGNAAIALSYYEHYVAQDKGYLNDASARAMAYQVVQQHLLTQKLETDALGKQNNILRLQRALDTKAVETSRLYIVLLLVTLTSIVFWLFRLKRSQLRYKKLSNHDGLTGIFNHQHFVGEAGRALHLLEKKLDQACLISLDLDHFKQVNDVHGHAMGDAVLKRTVAICQQQLRPIDLFGRLGGEEFGILLLDCSREQGMAIAERIRSAIGATEVDRNGTVVSFSASFGLACTDTSGYVLQRLYMEADAALYRAKHAGRNRVMTDAGSNSLSSALPLTL
ncbi:GGDEF domain-containing protein [Dyella halodurans]|uniref:diguanylate cyclase n=2 Tax=Dyella halodurans TaxID=1920171 RepID=A0ABV9BY47_9GAMM|nr:GGDEF domain-containing protein [Dyella halodurans]